MYAIQSKKRKNSRRFEKIVFETEQKDEIKNYLNENNYTIIGKPYIFTHIDIQDQNNNHQIITCSYNKIICSPEELYNQLTN